MQLTGLAGNIWLERSAVELLPLWGEKDLVWIFKPLPGKFFFFFLWCDRWSSAEILWPLIYAFSSGELDHLLMCPAVALTGPQSRQRQSAGEREKWCALLLATLTNRLCDPGQADEVHCASIFSSVNEKEWTREGISKTLVQEF